MTVGDSGLCCCVCVTCFEQITNTPKQAYTTSLHQHQSVKLFSRSAFNSCASVHSCRVCVLKQSDCAAVQIKERGRHANFEQRGKEPFNAEGSDAHRGGKLVLVALL